jgi:hypothetical protein
MAPLDVDILLRDMDAVLGTRDAVPSGDDPGLTMEEWRKEWGLSRDATYRRLHELSAAGLLVVGRRSVPTVSGGNNRLPVYRAKTA